MQLENDGIILLTILIMIFILLTTLCFIYYLFIIKKLKKNNSIIVPMLYDQELNRIRMMDSKYYDSALIIFKNKPNIYSGNWIQINQFLEIISKKDRKKLSNNFKNWDHSNLEISIIEKHNQKSVEKKYNFIFTGEEEKTLVIYKNNYIPNNIKVFHNLANKIKIKSLSNMKVTKNFLMFYAFSLKEHFNSEKGIRKLMEILFTQNLSLLLLIKEIYYEKDKLIFVFNNKDKKTLIFYKKWLLNKFKKFKNNFFFNEQAIIISEKDNDKNFISKINKIINFSLWKSKQTKTVFDISTPFFVDYANELEIYNSNKDKYRNLINNEQVPYIFSLIKKNNQKIGQIITANIDEQIFLYLTSEEKNKIIEKLFWQYSENSTKTDFLFLDDSSVLKNFEKLNTQLSNLIVMTNDYLKFTEECLSISETSERKLERWGFSLKTINENLFSAIRNMTPNFLIISKELTDNLNKDKILLSLESLYEISKANNITLIYETDMKKDQKVLEKIGCKYHFLIK
ncbi:MHO_4530 family protein [Mesomycoplasma lagogenitalium]|uniref:EAL domain-containing protein n=1 Tax=Mesomycoplasma lagogenitalium TaxID=171286 RepID=A0ABY8LUQ7_9BACT|nr:hypothetical protein [Mesomycoplasma lagogenitalium]WGI36964.1 hypothetical protein QEG99_01620 [Mesomycoplasma lagogenitalium]